MTRRIVRTSAQLGALAFLIILLVYFLDTRYRVLPMSIHTHLPTHHPGLVVTDITVKTCSFSSCKLDPTIWHRVEKDLLLQTGWITKSYVHIQRKKEEELTTEDKVVMDVRIGRLDPSKTEEGAKDKEGAWEKRPGGLWIKRSGRRRDGESSNVVTAVDILYGADAVDPRPGWMIQDQSLLLDYPRDAPEARMSIRRGSPKKLEMPVPRVRKDGKFKIMQLADLHLSTGLGTCRDAAPPGGPNGSPGNCEADPRTLEFVTRLLDQEKADFVVLSGDQVNGETAPDAQSAIFKFVDILATRKIPYAAIYGNHDDEGSITRQQTAQLMSEMPYSLTQPGPNTIPGVGNYYVRVLGHAGHHSALTMYFLDSHSYSPDEKKYRGYDWIKPEQIKWFKDAAESLKQDDKKYSHIHLDMAFIHIPLPEYRDGGILTGERREPPTAPGYNSGFRDALVEMGVPVVSCGHDHANDYCLLNEKSPGGSSVPSTLEGTPQRRDAAPPGTKPQTDDTSPPTSSSEDTKDSLNAPTHQHESAATKQNKIWLGYGGGSGFGGYGGYNNYVRRVRFFELDANNAAIRTWKRVEAGTKEELARRVDEQLIVDAGRVVGG